MIYIYIYIYMPESLGIPDAVVRRTPAEERSRERRERESGMSWVSSGARGTQ